MLEKRDSEYGDYSAIDDDKVEQDISKESQGVVLIANEYIKLIL